MPKRVPVPVGSVIGRWTVLAVASKRPDGAAQWLCRCDCGREVVVNANSLRRGHTKSCGCRRSEEASAKAARHGHARHIAKRPPEYHVWVAMRQRVVTGSCGPNRRNYIDRGIACCARWDSFENFLADMGPRPSPKHSIDRIDTNGNYEPANCRWATSTEQGRNRRNNRRLTFDGETLTVTEWAIRVGITRATIYARLNRGWPVERALISPTRPTRRAA